MCSFLHERLGKHKIILFFGDKGKAIRVTGRGGPYSSETSRLPHFLDSRLRDGGEVVRLTRQLTALYPPRKIRGTHFC
jgi:hypothetical protein